MRFSAVLATLLPVGAALAQQTFQIVVGNNSELTFSPSSISNAATGDTIQFIFATKNHTATQSSFAAPCSELAPPAGQQPIDSGFMPVAAGTTSNFPTYTVQLTNVTGPLWFYCKQTNPANHCQAGMVFAVNPTADKSFDAFQAAAKALASTASNSTSSSAAAPAGSSSAAASATGLTIPAAGSASAGSPAATDSAAAAASSGASSPAASGSTTNTSATDAPAATNSSPADKLHIGAASALVGGLGFLALAL
ncbi:hypothetical protein EIP86_004365 [Pleurotus ostreatoroseus]|nr:hypothetical protein EIP86_004365 [Pleurotus ostreatoroseus]